MLMSMFTCADGADQLIVPLLECSSGEPYEYIIPSFPVLDVKLRRVKYEVNIPHKDTTVVLDGFIKDDPTLDHPNSDPIWCTEPWYLPW